MNKIFLIATTILVFAISSITAQESTVESGGYKFSMLKEISATPVEDQYLTGTCWSYASVGLVETEMIRMGKDAVDLSEMYVVRMCYEDKAKNYVRMHGRCNFDEGGAIDDGLKVYKKYGAIPEKVYSGLLYGESNHNHNELKYLLEEYLKGVIKNKNGRLSTAWFEGYKGILDAYLGEVPEKFTYKGKEYTPRTFADDEIGLNPDDYMFFSSFTHHPFYESFVLEVPDNWMWESYMNVTIDDMTAIMDNSIKNGYAVVWGTDFSETSLIKTNEQIGVVPEDNLDLLSNVDISGWENMSDHDKIRTIFSFERPMPEKVITPEMRQKAFDNYRTTDDHGMLITGIAEDQYGTQYYYVKNSWGKLHSFDGYMYASKAFTQYKTTWWGVHKDGVPKEILKKIGL